MAEDVVAVTGGTGFVGGALVRELAEAGMRLRLLVRPGSDRRNIAGLAAELVEGDMRDAASLSELVAGARLLYHVAADYRIWVPDEARMHRVNVTGTVELLRMAWQAGVERIVYTSSVAAIAPVVGGIADEDSPTQLANLPGTYKRSKFLAERAVRQLIEEGAPIVIVNPSAPIGPGDIKPTPTGRMVREAALGRMPAVVDTGLNVVHVRDVARGHMLAASHGRIGRRYILGGENMALVEIIGSIARLAGHRPPRVRLPIAPLLPIAHMAEWWCRRRGGEPFLTRDALQMARKYMYFSSARAEHELGYTRLPVQQAFHDAVDWMRHEGWLA